MRTGYFTHPFCRQHDMGDGHPECPDRLDAIHDRLIATGLADVLDQRESSEASLTDIELAHSRNHTSALRGHSARLADDMAAGGPAHLQIDPDTSMNGHTWAASLRAAGAALDATDAVIAGELDNAFCAVRPPGHHACHDKAMGFCFFNNVAIAAKYALERHGLQRVAVVDFDVHHGNGTEDILCGDPRVLMVGIFQHPFYPYAGAGSDGTAPAANMHNLPVPAYTRGMAVRALFEADLLPKLEAFKPEMVFISAGFDAHREDELGQLGLVEADFEWLTVQIKHIAMRHAKGRIVSCLEGGYALGALARSVEAHIRVLADV
jgi:acetoin utilization deacetylase AcuC-like enzyme